MEAAAAAPLSHHSCHIRCLALAPAECKRGQHSHLLLCELTEMPHGVIFMRIGCEIKDMRAVSYYFRGETVAFRAPCGILFT
jgi:hypothetical protein